MITLSSSLREARPDLKELVPANLPPVVTEQSPSSVHRIVEAPRKRGRPPKRKMEEQGGAPTKRTSKKDTAAERELFIQRANMTRVEELEQRVAQQRETIAQLEQALAIASQEIDTLKGRVALRDVQVTDLEQELQTCVCRLRPTPAPLPVSFDDLHLPQEFLSFDDPPFDS